MYVNLVDNNCVVIFVIDVVAALLKRCDLFYETRANGKDDILI